MTSSLPAFATEFSEGTPPSLETGHGTQQRLAVPKEVAARTAELEDWLLTNPAPAWVAPVGGELRDGFGPRLARPVAGVSGMHRGQDLGASCGQPVLAASAGVVVQAGWYGTYGNWVLIDHGNGVTTGYAHNGSLSVGIGDRVEPGQQIALAGTTGASSGCHVHLEARVGQAAIDPVGYLQQKGVRLG